MTPVLHQHPFASYCWKAKIALYEREIPFEAVQIDDDDDRARLAELWPMGGMPVLVDEEAGRTVVESSLVIEYLDRFGEAAPMIPTDPDLALAARLLDRIFDSYVMAPMQKIVLDNLRPEGEGDTYGVSEAHQNLERAYEMLESRLDDQWAAGPEFSIADCSAAPSLHYAYAVHRWEEDRLVNLDGYFRRLMERPSVRRTVDEARPFRDFFPPGWPDYVD